jgi:hypothetical protein
MSKPTRKFVLFVPGTRGPSVSHNTIEEARAEAKRLIEYAGAAQALVFEFVEGLEKVTSVKAIKSNPLPNDEGMPF